MEATTRVRSDGLFPRATSTAKIGGGVGATSVAGARSLAPCDIALRSWHDEPHNQRRVNMARARGGLVSVWQWCRLRPQCPNDDASRCTGEAVPLMSLTCVRPYSMNHVGPSEVLKHTFAAELGPLSCPTHPCVGVASQGRRASSHHKVMKVAGTPPSVVLDLATDGNHRTY